MTTLEKPLGGPRVVRAVSDSMQQAFGAGVGTLDGCGQFAITSAKSGTFKKQGATTQMPKKKKVPKHRHFITSPVPNDYWEEFDAFCKTVGAAGKEPKARVIREAVAFYMAASREPYANDFLKLRVRIQSAKISQEPGSKKD